MGCSPSTRTGKVLPATHQKARHAPALEKDDNMNVEEGRGSTTRRSIDKIEPIKRMASIRTRRRLSVTPEMVADISDYIEPVKVDCETTTTREGEPSTEVELFTFFAVSRKGFLPYHKAKINQDIFICESSFGPNNDLQLFGVADGHGKKGELVSAFIKRHLPRILAVQGDIYSDPKNAMRTATRLMCSKLESSGINLGSCGSTLVFSLKVDETLYTANVGDSRAVVGKCGANNKMEAEDLSIDQKPENPLEKDRILASGGRVAPLPGSDWPIRVWLKHIDIPGLAMSRSIGDAIAHSVGVIDEPEILEKKITDQDKLIIWASDGLWEFISSQQAVDMAAKCLQNNSSARDISMMLVEEAVKAWRNEEEVIDDTTVVTLLFK